jgi:flagellar motor switch protein FliN/FliY
MSDNENLDKDSNSWVGPLSGESENPNSNSNPEQGGPFIDEGPSAKSNGNSAFSGSTPLGDINMVLDIPVQLTVELGRTRVPIKYILQLAQGSVVELESMAGGPMDVLINGYLIAQGEVVVVNEKFGIRLTDVVTPSERLRRSSRQHVG